MRYWRERWDEDAGFARVPDNAEGEYLDPETRQWVPRDGLAAEILSSGDWMPVTAAEAETAAHKPALAG